MSWLSILGINPPKNISNKELFNALVLGKERTIPENAKILSPIPTESSNNTVATLNTGIQEKKGGLLSMLSGLLPQTSVEGSTPPEKLEEQRANFQRLVAEREKASKMFDNSNQQPQRTSTPYDSWANEQRSSSIREDVKGYIDNKLLPLTRKFGIPDVLAAVQWALEGGRDTTKDNPFGLKRGEEVLDYGSAEDNIRAYDETLRNIISTNMGIPQETFNYSDYDPETLLHFLQFQQNGQPGKLRYEAHMEDPQSYIDLIRDMPEWRYYK